MQARLKIGVSSRLRTRYGIILNNTYIKNRKQLYIQIIMRFN